MAGVAPGELSNSIEPVPDNLTQQQHYCSAGRRTVAYSGRCCWAAQAGGDLITAAGGGGGSTLLLLPVASSALSHIDETLHPWPLAIGHWAQSHHLVFSFNITSFFQTSSENKIICIFIKYHIFEFSSVIQFNSHNKFLLKERDRDIRLFLNSRSLLMVTKRLYNY